MNRSWKAVIRCSKLVAKSYDVKLRGPVKAKTHLPYDRITIGANFEYKVTKILPTAHVMFSSMLY